MKKTILSSLLTILIIGMLFLSGTAKAIEVNLNTPNISSTDLTKTFEISIEVHNGEFLPILYTDIIFDDGTNEKTCRVEDKETNCDFLTIESINIDGLESREDYGYGYDGNSYQNFGYGYGYGREIIGTGVINYTLKINVLKLPDSFIGSTIDVTAKVYGDSETFFKGTSSFTTDESIGEKETNIDINKDEIIIYGDIVLDIPEDTLPEGTTKIVINRVSLEQPLKNEWKMFSKTYEFDIDNVDKQFSKPLTITFTYTDEELSLFGITDESKIFPAYYDTDKEDWVEITTGISRNTEENKLSFEVDHFTAFTLIADTSTKKTSTHSSSGGGTRVGVIPANKDNIPPTIKIEAGGSITKLEQPKIEESKQEPVKSETNIYFWITALIVIVICVIGYFIFRKKKEPEVMVVNTETKPKC